MQVLKAFKSGKSIDMVEFILSGELFMYKLDLRLSISAPYAHVRVDLHSHEVP